jgi:hypothetical protein
VRVAAGGKAVVIGRRMCEDCSAKTNPRCGIPRRWRHVCTSLRVSAVATCRKYTGGAWRWLQRPRPLAGSGCRPTAGGAGAATARRGTRAR